MDQITLRRAAAPDMEAILKLQVAVFEGEQGIPGELVCSPGDHFLQWWCALEGDSVVGAVAAWKEGEQVHWGRFAVHNMHRGRGIGTKLAVFSLEDLFSRGFEEIYMEAREATVAIICRLGGRVVGKPVAFYKGTVTPVRLHRDDYCCFPG